MKKTILVTGWLGYIWSHWIVAFEEAWYKTVIVDNLSNSSIKALDWIEKILWYKPDFFQLDLRDKNELKKVFDKYDFDWVLHFAWLKAVWESVQKPLEYFDSNIVWSLKLFELMKEFWVKNIIFSSSATVYKSLENEVRWLKEDDLTWETTNPYWTTKFLLENILRDLSSFAWFNVMNLRYFNPIWSHASWYIWEDPSWVPSNLLPYVMRVVTWQYDEVKVFWNDHNTLDWTWVRDYIDVCDLIDGHLKAYKFLEKSWGNWILKTYNLWTWSGNSVLEIIKTVENVTWKKINYKIVERRPWDLAEVFCNPEKAYKELNWKANISLEESIKNMFKFYINN